MAESYITRKGGGGGVGKYSTWVAQAENSANYTVYNGYDAVTNPNPNLSNLPYNQWLLNNSASGSILINNATLTLLGNYNTPNVLEVNTGHVWSFYKSNLSGYSTQGIIFSNNNTLLYKLHTNYTNPFRTRIAIYNANTQASSQPINSSSDFGYNEQTWTFYLSNNFLYVGGFNNNNRVRKINIINNYQEVGELNTSNRGAFSATVYNNILYVFRGDRMDLYHESNLVYINNFATNYSESYQVSAVNAYGYDDKFLVGNQLFNLQSRTLINTVSPNPFSPHLDESFIYSIESGVLRKYHKNNLVLAATGPTFSTFWSTIRGLGVYNNTYYSVYATNNGNQTYFIRQNTNTLSVVFNGNVYNSSFSGGSSFVFPQGRTAVSDQSTDVIIVSARTDTSNESRWVRITNRQNVRENIFSINRIKE
jgi:hypothetical protein